MSKQADINFKMRSILIDWLVEVHHKFKLQTATLWLCINILDRYLDSTSILRSKLQLVGVTSLFIACKFEELFPPEVRDCVYITDFAYDREEVLKMETSILTKLNYDILVPTGFHFLTRYLNCIKASERTRLVAAYYSERNLQEADMLGVPSHKFAAAAVLAALKQQTCQFEDHDKLSMCSSWPRVLAEESGLSELEVTPVMNWMVRHVSEEPQTTSKRKLVAAKKKFSNDKYQNVSELPLPDFD
jgi:cyclin B